MTIFIKILYILSRFQSYKNAVVLYYVNSEYIVLMTVCLNEYTFV